jgi:hypothetical protein
VLRYALACFGLFRLSIWMEVRWGFPHASVNLALVQKRQGNSLNLPRFSAKDNAHLPAACATPPRFN